MKERIRFIREKNKMSRAAFGERLGVSGDVINNLERGRVEIKDHFIKLICLQFNVNEEWLRTGEGSYEASSASFNLDDFAKSRNVNEIELRILQTYFELDPKIRHEVIEHFRNHLFTDISNNETSVPDEKERKEKIIKALNYQLELEASRTEKSSVSSDVL